jgi:sugar lactone lactonase YvrE
MEYGQIPSERVAIAGRGFNGPEAVAFDQEGNLYGGGQDGVIYRMAPSGRTEPFATVGGRPAGLAFDREDMLFVCEPISGTVVRVDRAGDTTSFAQHAGDHRIRVPNFCTFDADGNLYVSDSTDRPEPGWIAREAVEPRPGGALVRLTPDGAGEVVVRGLYLANGTAIDPREEYIYVLQSTTHDCVRVALGTPSTEVEPYGPDLGATPDGMAFDANGNLIVTLPQVNRLVVIDPQQGLTTLVDDTNGTVVQQPTNCAFGGERFDELHIAHLHADHVAKVTLGQAGHRLFNQRRPM